MGSRVKKKRLHSCNVLDSSPLERHLWHFTVEREDVRFQREITVPARATLPLKVVQKDWRDLYRPRFNIAWLPGAQVFLQVIQLPAVDRQELLSMVEFQLERLSPLPVAQILWSVEVIPSSAEKTQTALVCIVSRDAVEGFLGKAEEQGYQPDRLEVPQLNQIMADGLREDGGWIYPGTGSESDLCTVAWWSGGTLQELELVRLPQPVLASGSTALDAQAGRSEFLREQLMQTAWAGEMEGWLQLPVKWHLVADEANAAIWLPLMTSWAQEGVEIHPALDRTGVAKYSSRRAALGDGSPDLLPADFAARYHQQYVDRLWMRGLGAVVGLYIIGVAIFLVALQVYSFKDNRLKTQIAGIANTYTNVLRLKERVQVLQEQLALKYAALDCFKVASEQLPADFTLVSLAFSGGRTLRLQGTAPQGEEQKVIEYNENLRKATVNGQPLFRDVLPPNTYGRQGSQLLNWNFDCQLNVSDAVQ